MASAVINLCELSNGWIFIHNPVNGKAVRQNNYILHSFSLNNI